MNRQKIKNGLGWLSMAAIAAVAASTLGPASVGAQNYPNKPINAIVPFAAGGGADTQTRIWSDAMASILGQRIVIENVPAAAGVPGTKQGIAADPDGYSVVMGVASTIAINPVTNKAANYNALEDLKAVAILGYTPYVMVVANNLNIKTFPELLNYAKANSDKVTYASWTSVGDFARKGLELRAGLTMTSVPYKGGPDAINDIIAGRVSATILDIGTAMPFIKAGSVTPIAMTGPDKSPALPNVQSITEAGVKNYFIDSWTALFVPKDTPQAIVETLNSKTRQALSTKNVKDRYAELAIQQLDYDAGETKAFMERQVKGWKTLIEDTKNVK
ncbi:MULTISPECIES: tripartite tricarboxylate transporter substrate binding protein [unclassified Neorhizobium]|uniref:Bug family tripartite tricarboxylate transporter substrate binding protein n=1 Tax=unclassified Neorhizobium TaxID=2629175 RepID=UPI001FF42336|nr:MULTISPECIES: tripartite tricarboxylate transporter substrate binding protein [unclassified Neorhizobium]MCJ9669457.1 tripartite tricarboxylate transporter substrate binding protein [Neorhizobium sp. SHOUNA12B]MCJ9745518.1 tripartite tricarboxylate transporter substrate binding protein [Neorhizobium sp. SHOUNA12A]